MNEDLKKVIYIQLIPILYDTFLYLGGPALKDPFTWGKVDMTAMARCLLVLCKQIYSIFIKEDRLLRISSACYIRKKKSKTIFLIDIILFFLL